MELEFEKENKLTISHIPYILDLIFIYFRLLDILIAMKICKKWYNNSVIQSVLKNQQEKYSWRKIGYITYNYVCLREFKGNITECGIKAYSDLSCEKNMISLAIISCHRIFNYRIKKATLTFVSLNHETMVSIRDKLLENGYKLLQTHRQTRHYYSEIENITVIMNKLGMIKVNDISEEKLRKTIKFFKPLLKNF